MQANRTEAVDALLDMSRALVAMSARAVADAGSQVTLPQFRLLVVLSERERRLVDLADELQVVPSTAARMVDRLVHSDLVARRTPSENRRETRLSVTARGRRLVRTTTDRRRADLGVVVDRLSDRQVSDLLRAVRTLAGAAEGLRPQTV